MALRSIHNESSMDGVLPSANELGGSNHSASKLRYGLKNERKIARRNNEKKMIQDFMNGTSEDN